MMGNIFSYDNVNNLIYNINNNIPNNTNREQNIQNNGVGNIAKNNLQYIYDKYNNIPNNTKKDQSLSNSCGNVYLKKNKLNRGDSDNMHINESKEKIIKGREPTKIGITMGPTMEYTKYRMK